MRRRKIFHIILYFVAIVFALIIVAASALHNPRIQTKIAKKLASVISEKIDMPVEIGYVNLLWYDELYAEQISIRDSKGERMIDIDELTLDFSLSTLFNKKETHIDNAIISRAIVSLNNNTPDSVMNISHFVKRIREVLSSGRKKGKNKAFSIGSIRLNNSGFSLNNIFRDSLDDRWDFSHFAFNGLDGNLKNLRIHADTFEVDISRLDGLDRQTNMEIKNLRTFFSISNTSMVMKDLEAEIGSTSIRNDMTFLFDSLDHLSDFNRLVNIRADLSQSKIYSKDLAWFAPAFKRFDEYFTLQGKFRGSISRFDFNDFVFSMGEKTVLQGNMNITGLPDYRETMFDIDLDQSYLLSSDFEGLLTENAYKTIRRLDFVTADDVTLTGFLIDFVARGKFRSPLLGYINSDINLKVNEDPNLSTYSGRLAVSGFNIGKILDKEDLFDQVDMRGSISGKGLTPGSMDINLNAFFNYLDFHNYRYTNINADARFNKDMFSGSLMINDENLKAQANGFIDLREGQKKIEFTASVDSASLEDLKLSRNGFNLLKGRINVDLTGLKPDELLGSIDLNNIHIIRNNRDLIIDHINIVSEKNGSERLFQVNSNLLSAFAKGNFDYTQLVDDLKNQFEEYRLTIMNQQENIKSYYARKKQQAKMHGEYFLEYFIQLNDINPFIQLYSPAAYVSLNSNIEGRLTGGQNRSVTILSDIDTIDLGKYAFYENHFDISFGKSIDNPDVDASALIASSRQSIDRIERTQALQTVVDWEGKRLDFLVGFSLINPENYASVRGKMDFLDKGTLMTINSDSSVVKILEKNWLFSKDNRFFIADNVIQISNVILQNAEQSISLNGAFNRGPENNEFVLDVRNFTLDNLNPIIKKEFNGVVNGGLNISKFNDDIILESQVLVDDFQIEKFLVGDVKLNSFWNNQVKHMNIGMDVIRNDSKMIAMNGYIDPALKDDQLHLYAYLNKANLNIAEPFIKSLFTGIDGNATGEFTIRGTLAQPKFLGKGLIEDGRIKVNYLNTVYTFSGEVTLDEDKIGVDNLSVRDDEMNRASFTGGFYHTGLKNFIMDIHGRAENFKVLNTTARNNDLYYGVAVVSGNIDFFGAPTNLSISANATTQRGTRIYIPLSGSSTVEQENFIRFITEKENILSTEGDDVNKMDLRGLRMDFDLEITPEAYCELIFDIKAGDIIRGRGNGQIKLQIDTESDFRMFGDFEIMEGGYNFTLYNVINKDFNIIPSSTITWTGDPYKAQLNIKATYDQVASLAPLLDSALWSYSELKRKYPARVILDLKGDLMSPDINFDIDITDYPTVISGGSSGPYSLEMDINAFKNKIKADEQELKRQVFSLMVLRRFSPENSFNVSGSLGNSVSEWISNQLSYWITQFDENLEIDVDLNSLDQEILNTFQLRLSYTILDGRLRITRDGGFTHQQNQANLGSIAGDWTVEYLLTPNGKLRVKMYNKTNYNYFAQSFSKQSQTSTTAGFSLSHTESFNRLNEVFRNIRERRSFGEEDEETDENQTTLPEVIYKEDQELLPRKIN